MLAALEEAKNAEAQGEVPIGAVIVDPQSGEIVARAGNRTIAQNDPSAHAEILAIRAACDAAGSQRIPGMDLYVTLEPCTMCAAAISFARIRRVVIAADDPKGGAVLNGVEFYKQPTCHHRPVIDRADPALQAESSTLLKQFFKSRRKK